MTELFQLLDTHAITYDRYDHPPVYTVEDVERLLPDLPGAKTKNLFLRDQKGKRHFLVVVPHDKRVDLKVLPAVLGAKRISFGSPDRLQALLAIEPGSVSLLAVINDTVNAVELFMDQDLWTAETFQFHPLVNTSTLVLGRKDVQRFAEMTNHPLTIIEVPAVR